MQEKKKKELEELDAVFAELGIDLPPGQEQAAAAAEGGAAAASKKKKKDKKDKPTEGSAENDKPDGAAAADGAAEAKQEPEEPVELVDPATVRLPFGACWGLLLGPRAPHRVGRLVCWLGGGGRGWLSLCLGVRNVCVCVDERLPLDGGVHG